MDPSSGSIGVISSRVPFVFTPVQGFETPDEPRGAGYSVQARARYQYDLFRFKTHFAGVRPRCLLPYPAGQPIQPTVLLVDVKTMSSIKTILLTYRNTRPFRI